MRSAPGPGVAQVQAGVAAHLAEIVVVRFGDGEVQVLAQQRQQLRSPVGLDLGLERVAPGEGEPGLAERRGEPAIGRKALLVHAGRVHDRASCAARVGASAAIVRALWLLGRARPRRRASRASVPVRASVRVNFLSFDPRWRSGGCRTAAARRRAGRALVPRRHCACSGQRARVRPALPLPLASPCAVPSGLRPPPRRGYWRRTATAADARPGTGAGSRSMASATWMAADKKSTRGDSDPMTRRSIGQVDMASRPRAGASRSAVSAAQM